MPKSELLPPLLHFCSMDRVVCEDALKPLKSQLLRFGFLNLLIVAVLGLTLRSSIFSGLPFNYGYLLHGHSHFAFGGWLMPMMVWMILQYFPSLASKISFNYWRNISVAILFSAYGMLASFPFQGYGPVSIVFSTLAVLAGFYLAVVLFKALRLEENKVSLMFLRWGLIYLVLSSIGPFATGPLIAMGKQGSPIYFDAIYFYLHFQYNGWFVFMVLAVLYELLGLKARHGQKVFYLFNLACLPAYFLSVLWDHPPAIFYWIGGIGALLQVIGLVYLVKDFLLLGETNRFVRSLLLLVMMAFIIKNLLQLLSAVPFFADMAYQNRNLVIAYLHLVLLGFVSLFSMAMVLRNAAHLFQAGFKKFLMVFFAGFVGTEVLLVANGLGLIVSSAGWSLFAISLLLVAGAIGMAVAVWSGLTAAVSLKIDGVE